MRPQTTDYSLLESISSVEDFLKVQFKASSSKIKKFFKKSFLMRALPARSVLSLPLDFINDGEINSLYEGPPLEVLYEDEAFFVFNKNPNQFIHPLSYSERDNCLSYLRSVRPELLKVNCPHYDRGLLYRLDYETSGVVIYVKSEKLYRELRGHFAEVAREKMYWCWVEGECHLEGSYQHSFSSGEEKGKRVLVGDFPEGMKGELSVKVLERDLKRGMSLLQVSLKSGLRHQIRAQLAYLGHPLRGDVFYGGKPALRLYLHAYSYQIVALGKSFLFSSKPSDFNGS